jgi:hypothetical protein
MLHLRLIIFLMGDDVPVNNETLLLIEFVNLKIKSTQSFECVHKNRVCTRMFIGVSTRTCMSMSIYVCTVFLKNNNNQTFYSQGS